MPMQTRLNQIDMKNVPAHVAVIMDGNGRWAKKHSLPRSEGHRRGSEVIIELVDAAVAAGVKVVSLYAFSTENWSRPKSEITGLWNLFESFFYKELPVLQEKRVRVLHSGTKQFLPKKMAAQIDQVVAETSRNTKITLNLCLNYGGRQEIIAAFNAWNQTHPGKVLKENEFEKYLYTAGLPDVDLMIRTSGESRISNFLLWQCAYAEFVFMNVLWPDFKPRHLYQAIQEYQKRTRRFGGL